jgi:hypothetical protein
MIESLEGRLLCRVSSNGEFVISPPGGGQGQSTLHQHPQAGVIGLQTAEARSNGVNWQVTSVIEIPTPPDHAGPPGA